MIHTLASFLKKRGRHRMIYRTRNGIPENYLERFYILSTPWLGIYLHRFWSDDDDGLHDHPWNSVSILLEGAYLEEMPERQSVPQGPTVTKLRHPFHPLFYVRSKYDCHRITIPKSYLNRRFPDQFPEETWSLFIRFGLKRRKWGFYEKGTWQEAPVQSRNSGKM